MPTSIESYKQIIFISYVVSPNFQHTILLILYSLIGNTKSAQQQLSGSIHADNSVSLDSELVINICVIRKPPKFERTLTRVVSCYYILIDLWNNQLEVSQPV